MKRKLLLTLLLVLSLTTSVMAYKKDIPVNVTAQPITFCVAAPTVLPAYKGEDGVVLSANKIKFINEGYGPVAIKDCSYSVDVHYPERVIGQSESSEKITYTPTPDKEGITEEKVIFTLAWDME